MSSSKLQALSSGGDLFAYSEPSGIIKFWDTVSAKLVHEFQPADHVCASPTCLQFLVPKKGKKTGISGIYDTDLLAIGNVAGKILIYSPKQKRLLSTLALDKSSIVDIAWKNNSTLISLAKDKTITAWNISTGEKRSEHFVEGNRSLCILGANTLVVASYGLQLLKFNELNIETLTNYIGKSQEIVQLLALRDESLPIAKYFLSALNGSKLLYAWQAKPKDKKYLTRSITVFNAEDTIDTVSCFQLKTHSAGIICTTKKGTLKYFTNYFDGNITKPEPPKLPRAELSVACEVSGKNLHIMGAYFLSSDTILIIYGSSLFPAFERIPVDCLTEKIVLKRVDPMITNAKAERNLLRVVSASILDSASCLSPAQSLMTQQWSRKRLGSADKIDEQSTKYQKV